MCILAETVLTLAETGHAAVGGLVLWLFKELLLCFWYSEQSRMTNKTLLSICCCFKSSVYVLNGWGFFQIEEKRMKKMRDKEEKER